MNRRIRRPTDQYKIYKEVTDKDSIGLFESYKDYFMLSAVVGLVVGEKREFTSSLELISWNVFNYETDLPVINLIYYLDRRDVNILYDDNEESFNEKITVIEEYAAAGAEIVYQKLIQDPTRARDVLISYFTKLNTRIKQEQHNDVNIIGEFLS
ncbi:hypothetical protein [Jeotgalibacillus marinus]|uniref:DNA phosphorothioation-associated protein 4 n=1 Tax=Jeotgalibacillus marinus TaxID=86667 RepID=A0ABV3Q5H2_9BACL